MSSIPCICQACTLPDIALSCSQPGQVIMHADGQHHPSAATLPQHSQLSLRPGPSTAGRSMAVRCTRTECGTSNARAPSRTFPWVPMRSPPHNQFHTWSSCKGVQQGRLVRREVVLVQLKSP